MYFTCGLLWCSLQVFSFFHLSRLPLISTMLSLSSAIFRQATQRFSSRDKYTSRLFLRQTSRSRQPLTRYRFAYSRAAIFQPCLSSSETEKRSHDLIRRGTERSPRLQCLL